MLFRAMRLAAPCVVLIVATASAEHYWTKKFDAGAPVYAVDTELRAAFNLANPDLLPESRRSPHSETDPAFDWTELVKPGPVHSQGKYGHCWAFGAVTAFEYAWAIRNGTTEVPRFSTQPILDRTGRNEGATVSVALDDLLKHGTCKAEVYPYVGHPDRGHVKVNMPYRLIAWGEVELYENLPEVSRLKQALIEHGPLACDIYVTPAFNAYRKGVFAEHAKLPKDVAGLVDHAVVILGWNDRLGTHGAWKIQNSWGNKWGMDGIGWIEYGCNNIGFRASWLRAQAVHYKLPDKLNTLISPDAEPYPVWPQAKVVTPIPATTFRHVTPEEIGRRPGERVEVEFVVKGWAIHNTVGQIELFSEPNEKSAGCIIVHVENPGKKLSKDEGLALSKRYYRNRVRVRGLVQAKQRPDGIRPLIEVWDPGQIEVLP
jgi:hypothetical protein